jgi:hypothetical protein
VRIDLADQLPADAIEAAMTAYEREGTRLAAAARGVEVVVRATELDLGTEQRPVGARPPLVGHTDAAGVDHAAVVEPAVELVVRVAADDGGLFDAVQDPAQPLVGGDGGDRLEIATRRAVAEERRPEALDLERQRRRPRVDPGAIVVRQLRLQPFVPRPPTLLVGPEVAVRVAVDERGARAEGPQLGERLGRHRSREGVAADHDRRLARHFFEHRFERREVAVDVVERRDLQTAASASTKPKKTTLMTPFNVKNAASSRRRSPGRTSACS